MAASKPTAQLSWTDDILLALSQLFRALTLRCVVPLLVVQLNQTPSLPASTLHADSELDRAPNPKVLNAQSVLYPACQLDRG